MMIEQQTIVPEIQPEPVRPAPEPASGRGPRRLVVLGAVVLVFILGAWGAFFLGRAPAEAPAEPNASSENPAVSQPPAEQAKLVFEPLPEIIAPLTPVDLRFKVATQTGLTIFDFNILNDRVLHTVFVRKDLRYFFHLHPRFETNTGTFSQTFSFPTPGDWPPPPFFPPPPPPRHLFFPPPGAPPHHAAPGPGGGNGAPRARFVAVSALQPDRRPS